MFYPYPPKSTSKTSPSSPAKLFDTLVIKIHKRHYEQFANSTVEDIEDDIPFEMPIGWAWCRLGEICDLKGGKRIPAGLRATKSPTEHIYIRVTDMKSNSISDEDLVYINETIFDKIKQYTISKNDLYLTIAGTIGRVGEVPEKFDGMNLTENALKLANICINKKYLMFILNTPFVQYYFESTYHQVAMPKLSLLNASKTFIPLPPLAEQHRIVTTIETIFAQIEELERNKSDLQTAIKQAKSKILDLAIHGKLVPQDPDDEPAEELLKRILTSDNHPYTKIGEDDAPFEVPIGWAWCKVEDLFILNPKNHIADDTNCGFIPMNCVDDGFGTHHRFEERTWKEIKKGFSHFQNGDIGIAKISPCFENRKSVIFENLPNGFGAGTTELTILRGIFVCTKFYLYLFQSAWYISEGTKYFKGVVGQQRVNKEIFTTLFIPLPPLAEQRRIVAKIEELFALLDSVTVSLSD